MNPRVPLADQLAELRRIMRSRKYRHAQFVASGEMTADQAAGHMERLQACIRTMEWLQRHETRLLRAADA